METDSLALSKMLHLLIQKFIKVLEKYIEFTNVDQNKVFIEVLKRNYNISQSIRLIALNFLDNEAAGRPVSDDILSDKAKSLLDACLQQDLIECALTFESTNWKHVSHGDLHELLYWFSVNDRNSMPSSFENDITDTHAGDFQFYHSAHSISSLPKTIKELDQVLLSSQFDGDRMQFDEELSQLKLTLESRSLSSDFKCSEADSKLNNDFIGSSRSTVSCVYNELDSLQHNSQSDDWLLHADVKSYDNISNFQNFSGITWEGRMKQFVPCHLYSSELTENEVSFNITNDDPQIFRTLYDSTTSLSEDNLKHDILDLLVGIPSNTFLYDSIKKKFQVKPHIHLVKLSHESTLRLVEKFIDSGTMFHKLQLFSTEFFVDEGFVFRGLKNGIKQVLKLYTEYIMAVKMKKPSLQFLKTDILEAAQSLNILGSMCRIRNKENDFIELPKGLGLLSHLNESLWPHRRKENALLIGVILKHAYVPYFNFLDKWMGEGICYDPFGEFQIIEDFKYLDKRDELYWKLAYTENSENPTRTVPLEIRSYSTDILQCGKNMRLLKICCPQLYSLEYMSSHPPPSLSILFSFNAATVKAEKCIAYIKSKEKAESEYSESQTETSEEDLLVLNQCFVTRADIALQSKSRYSSQHPCNLSTFDSSSARYACNKRGYNSLESMMSTASLYSVITYEAGILFSSCIYNNDNVYLDYNLKKNLQYSSDSCLDGQTLFKYRTHVSRTFHFKTSQDQNLQPKFIKKSATANFPSYPVPTSNLTICETDDDILPGTFMSSLASLLISGCKDTLQDVYSCLQMSSLQSLMFYNFRAVLDMRMHLVKKIVTDYVMNQLKLQDLLICLKNTYLLLDESFSQTLSEKLFSWSLKCQTTQEFSNWSVLNEIFCNSISENICASFPLLSTGSVNVVDLPENDILERNDFLHLFQFEFQINWPLNIIIHKACISQYMKIFSFLLELDFLCWLLGRTWRSLMFHGKAADIQNSSQFREIMLNRFDMHQFICVLRNCIRHDLQGPVWDFLSKSLSTEDLSIDALEEIHIQYLEQVLTRCFLTKETNVLHELVIVMSRQVYKFCMWTFDCTWEYHQTNKQYEISTFGDLTSISETYKKYQKAFYDHIMKLTVTRKYRVSGQDGFKQYLVTILESKRKFL